MFLARIVNDSVKETDRIMAEGIVDAVALSGEGSLDDRIKKLEAEYNKGSVLEMSFRLIVLCCLKSERERKEKS